MTVLSDKWIKKEAQKGMIKPFVNKQVRKGKISFGLSSYGYDARVSNEFKIFTNVNSGIVDPKVFKKESFVTKIGKEYVKINITNVQVPRCLSNVSCGLAPNFSNMDKKRISKPGTAAKIHTNTFNIFYLSQIFFMSLL